MSRRDQNSEFDLTQRSEQFDSIQRDKADRYENEFEKLKQRVLSASPNNYQQIESEIEAKIENIDESITTLQDNEEITEKDIKKIEKDVDLDDIEKQGNGQYHLTVKELKDNYEQLHKDTDARIRELQQYMADLADLKADLHRKVLTELDEERVHSTAVSKMQEWWSNRTEELMNVLTDRFSNLERELKNRLELMVQKETSDIERRMTELEAERELMESRLEQSMGIIETLAEGNPPNSNEIQRQAEKVQQLQRQDIETVASDTSAEPARETVTEQDQSPEQSSENGSEEAEIVDEDPAEDSGSNYVFMGRNMIEIKDMFAEMEESEPVEDLSKNELAERTDLEAETLQKRFDSVSDAFDEDEIADIPALKGDS